MAVQAELEVLVLKLEATAEPTGVEEHSDSFKSGKNKPHINSVSFLDALLESKCRIRKLDKRGMVRSPVWQIFKTANR